MRRLPGMVRIIKTALTPLLLVFVMSLGAVAATPAVLSTPSRLSLMRRLAWLRRDRRSLRAAISRSLPSGLSTIFYLAFSLGTSAGAGPGQPLRRALIPPWAAGDYTTKDT